MQLWQIIQNSGTQPWQAVKIACLSVADRILHLELYNKTDLTPRGHGILPMLARNRGLVDAFPAVLGGLDRPGTEDEQAAEQIKGWVDTWPVGYLLHLPGLIHEQAMSWDRGRKQPVRKEQGSYYTPVHVVRYMVDLALLRVFADGDTAGQTGFRVLDPACGGASFLLEMFNGLVDRGWEPVAAMESLYGVDKDHAAVELGVFALTLAALLQCPGQKAAEIKERLGRQLKTGNALAPPRSGQRDPGIPDCLTDWAEEFPEVFGHSDRQDGGGFDLILGNPPYVSNKLLPLAEKQYYTREFRTARGQFDLAVPFLEQGLNLLKERGVLCYITSNKFMGADYGLHLRRMLLEDHTVCDLIDVSTIKTFAGAAVYPVIITVRKGKAPAGNKVNVVRLNRWQDIAGVKPTCVEQEFFRRSDGRLLTTMVDHQTIPVINKINKVSGRIPPGIIRCGLAETGFNRWIVRSNGVDPDEPDRAEKPLITFIRAGHIRPYRIATTELIDPEMLRTAKVKDMREPKLVIPGIARSLIAAIDCSGSLLGRVYYIKESETGLDLGYLAALLNSKVLNFYYRVMYWPVHLEGGYLRFNSGYLAGLPVGSGIFESSARSRDQHRVRRNLAELSRLIAGLPPGDPQAMESSCRIDGEVFALYGLNEQEALYVMDFLGTERNEKETIIGFLRMAEGLATH